MTNVFPFDWVPQDVSWQDDAACRGDFQRRGKDLFFPPDNPGGPKQGHGVPGERARVKEAKLLCASCPVVRACLEFAWKNEVTGIWGGMTDRERKFAAAREAKGLIG